MFRKSLLVVILIALFSLVLIKAEAQTTPFVTDLRNPPEES